MGESCNSLLQILPKFIFLTRDALQLESEATRPYKNSNLLEAIEMLEKNNAFPDSRAGSIGHHRRVYVGNENKHQQQEQSLKNIKIKAFGDSMHLNQRWSVANHH